MRPSPFGNRPKKFGKKQIPSKKEVEENEERDEFPTEEKESVKKVHKKPKDIYAALDENEQQQKNIDGQTKKSVHLKPKFNLGGKKNKSRDKRQQEKQKQPEEDEPRQKPMLLKPTFKRKLQRRSKEKVVIEDNETNEKNEIEDSYEGSISQNPSIAPHFKIGRSRVEQTKIQIEENNEGNFQKNEIGVGRQISFQAPVQKVSEVKLERQKYRTQQLNKLLNLERDLFEQTLNISCVTSYEIYINKIKNGSLKNSCDQAFDDKTVSQSQTLTMEFDDFTNQCPQDYHTDIMNIVQADPNQLFNQFVERVSPVLQELIRPSNEVVMPPIFLLALRPVFKKFLKCPFPVFIYHSEEMNIGIIVIGQKLYISESQITSVLRIGNYLIAGGINGNIMLWSGKNNRGSRLYNKIYETIQSTNFQLPQYETNQLDKFSVYRTDAKISSLLMESNSEFLSLDENGTMIRWQIQSLPSKKNELKPCQSVQFQTLLRKNSLVAYSLLKRNENYFVNTSAGILVWNGQYILQKLNVQSSQVIDLCAPHRSNLIYVLCEDSSVRVFDQNYSNHLLRINFESKDKLTNIIVPQIQYQNRKISLTNNFFVAGSKNIYSFNLLKNKVEGKSIVNNDDEDRNIIYKGVNALAQGIQQVTLWKDLKCTSEVQRMNINLQSSPPNVKAILQENRKLYHMLQAQPGLVH